jgi:hypothetical protein
MPRGTKYNRKNRQYALMERRQEVARLYVVGRTQWDIAHHLGVSQATVSGDLDKIRKQWLDSTLRDFNTRVAEELAKLDAIEAAAWEGYARSCRSRRPGGAVRAGDPRFLTQAFQCVVTRLRIMGAFRPPDGKANHIVTQQVNWLDLLKMVDSGISAQPDPVEQRIAEVEALAGGRGGLPNGLKELPAPNGGSHPGAVAGNGAKTTGSPFLQGIRGRSGT